MKNIFVATRIFKVFFGRVYFLFIILHISNSFLSYDVAVIQWITSCRKNRMTTRVIILWRVDITSSTTSVSAMRILAEIMLIFWAIKSNFKGSYDKQNLTLVVISYEIYETHRKLVFLILYEMTTRVRSSMSQSAGIIAYMRTAMWCDEV